MSTSTKRAGTADDGAAAVTRAGEGRALIVVHGRVLWLRSSDQPNRAAAAAGCHPAAACPFGTVDQRGRAP